MAMEMVAQWRGIAGPDLEMAADISLQEIGDVGHVWLVAKGIMIASATDCISDEQYTAVFRALMGVSSRYGAWLDDEIYCDDDRLKG